MKFRGKRSPFLYKILDTMRGAWTKEQRERRNMRRRRSRRMAQHGFPAEVLESRTLLTLDFGDAPSPFPTPTARAGSRIS